MVTKVKIVRNIRKCSYTYIYMNTYSIEIDAIYLCT